MLPERGVRNLVEFTSLYLAAVGPFLAKYLLKLVFAVLLLATALWGRKRRIDRATEELHRRLDEMEARQARRREEREAGPV